MELVDNGMLGLPRAALAALRAALYRDAGPAAATYLQEAGYAGGETLFTAFRSWLKSRNEPEPESLPLERFETLATAFSRDAGWGSLAVGSLRSAVAVLEVECRSAGAHRCRFLVGNTEVMEHVYDTMGRGADYEAALGEVE